jgi:hypothetical protein
MQFNSLLKDILGFIGRLLRWREDPKNDQPKPFQAMRMLEGDFGIISLVEGRDTPRAVRSWIYSNKRLNLNSTRMVASSTQSEDLHIYLDFLGPLPGVVTPKSEKELKARQDSRRAGLPVKTHRLQILKASHFLNANGFYDYELVYWNDYDFYMPMNLSPEQVARILVDKLAHQCLQIPNPMEIEAADWESKIQGIWQEIRGRQFAQAS